MGNSLSFLKIKHDSRTASPLPGLQAPCSGPCQMLQSWGAVIWAGQETQAPGEHSSMWQKVSWWQPHVSLLSEPPPPASQTASPELAVGGLRGTMEIPALHITPGALYPNQRLPGVSRKQVLWQPEVWGSGRMVGFGPQVMVCLPWATGCVQVWHDQKLGQDAGDEKREEGTWCQRPLENMNQIEEKRRICEDKHLHSSRTPWDMPVLVRGLEMQCSQKDSAGADYLMLSHEVSKESWVFR